MKTIVRHWFDYGNHSHNLRFLALLMCIRHSSSLFLTRVNYIICMYVCLHSWIEFVWNDQKPNVPKWTEYGHMAAYISFQMKHKMIIAWCGVWSVTLNTDHDTDIKWYKSLICCESRVYTGLPIMLQIKWGSLWVWPILQQTTFSIRQQTNTIDIRFCFHSFSTLVMLPSLTLTRTRALISDLPLILRFRWKTTTKVFCTAILCLYLAHLRKSERIVHNNHGIVCSIVYKNWKRMDLNVCKGLLLRLFGVYRPYSVCVCVRFSVKVNGQYECGVITNGYLVFGIDSIWFDSEATLTKLNKHNG